MITKHNFNLDQKCTICGLIYRDAVKLGSKYCYMHNAPKDTYDEVQIDSLIHPLRDLGVKMMKNEQRH